MGDGFNEYGTDIINCDTKLYSTVTKIIYENYKKIDFDKLIPGLTISREKEVKAYIVTPGIMSTLIGVMLYKRKLIGTMCLRSANSNYNISIIIPYIDASTLKRIPALTICSPIDANRILSSDNYITTKLNNNKSLENAAWIEFGDWILHKFGSKQFEIFLERIKLIYG